MRRLSDKAISRVKTVLYGCCVSLLLNGCASVEYQAAVPQMPLGSKGGIYNEIIEIKLPDINFFTQLQAFNWGGQYLLPPLTLWLVVEPLEGPVDLNITKVILISDGIQLRKISYLGPSSSWFSPRALAAGCGPRFYRTGIGLTRFGASQDSVLNADNKLGIYRPLDMPISIDKKSCFMIWFDADGLPNHQFTLRIEGITKQGNKVEIPDIQFKEATLKQIRSFP